MELVFKAFVILINIEYELFEFSRIGNSRFNLLEFVQFSFNLTDFISKFENLVNSTLKIIEVAKDLNSLGVYIRLFILKIINLSKLELLKNFTG